MTIAVVVPVYNEQELLPACLEALLTQTRPLDEIIVVDNNSSDQTAAVALSRGVTVIKETQQGIMPAVYAGMEASNTDIIARCDADSIVPANWIELIEKNMLNNPTAAAVTGPGKFYGTGNLRAKLAQIWYMYAYFLLVGSALANWPLFGSNCAIRRSAWQSIKGELHRERADIHDDMEISVHIHPTWPVILVPSLVVGISARALKLKGMGRRYRYGWNTLRLHRPASVSWRRWRSKLKIGLE